MLEVHYLPAVGVGLVQLSGAGCGDGGHALAGDTAVSRGDAGRAGDQVGGGITSLYQRWISGMLLTAHIEDPIATRTMIHTLLMIPASRVRPWKPGSSRVAV